MPAEPDSRFAIRGYQRGDETKILELFARSFHQPRSIEHWRWKYENDPWGAHRISLGFNGEALVSHYAGYPTGFEMNGASVVANQIGDTMTDRSVRHVGRGPTSLLGRTALHFYENFCEGKVAFNYGFNVDNIQKFSLQFLRATRVEAVSYRRRDLVSEPLRPIGRLERYARGIQFELAGATSSEWDELFVRVAREYRFLVRRDARYVAWRYLARPDERYVIMGIRKWRRLVGWLVVRMREDRLTIGDLLLDPDHADVLEAALRHLAASFPARSFEMWCPPRPAWLHEILDGLRLRLEPEPQNLSVMCVPFAESEAPAKIADSLFYTMGDGDLF